VRAPLPQETETKAFPKLLLSEESSVKMLLQERIVERKATSTEGKISFLINSPLVLKLKNRGKSK
jgi:hypothetical protein